MAKKGVEFKTEDKQALAALKIFAGEVNKLDPLAYRLQGYEFNRIIFDTTRDRLAQVITGELKLDDAIKRIQEDMDKKLAETKK